MQYLRNLQSQVSPSLWIRSHREPNKQRDFNDSNSSSINISVISSSSNTATSFSTPVTTNPSYSSQHDNKKDNHHRHHHGDIISVSASSGRRKLSNTEIRSLSAFHNSNSSHSHNHNRVSSFKPSSNFNTDNNRKSSRRNSTSSSPPPLPSSSTGSVSQFEPVILSLTPLKSVKREYLRRNSSISSSGSGGITSLFHSANAAALLLPSSPSTDGINDLSSHFHNEPRHNDKDRDECLKDINNRKRITQNLERTRNSYDEGNIPSSILQADHEKQSSVLLLVDDPLLHILGRRETLKIVQPSSKDDNLVLLPEYHHDENGKKIEKIRKNSFVENDENITPFVVHDTTLLSPETNETTSKTGNSSSNNKYINNNDIFVVASGTTTHHHQKLSSFTEIDRNVSTANRISTSTPTTKNSHHHHQHHHILLHQQRKGSLIQQTVHSTSDARQIQSCRESERIRKPSHSFVDEEKTSQTFALPPSPPLHPHPPADPDFPAEQEAIPENATGTSQDQSSPSCSSRISTFTRDSSRRFSTNSSTSTLFSESDSSVSSVSDLASVILVAPNQDKQEDDKGAPVVVSPTLSTLSTNSSTTSLPCDSVSSGGLFYVEGLSCSHKVNQRKKSGTHYNKNNSSSADNVINSEKGRIKRKRSIIQYLLCTPPGFNLFRSPKKLLSAIFRRRQRTKLVKRRQVNSSRKRIVCLSFSPSYSSSGSENNRPINSKNLVRSRKRAAKRQRELIKLQNTPSRGPNKGELRLWATMDHEDLIRELPQIEKLSNQERLRLAHKRRMLQLKKFQQYEKDLNSNSKKHRGDSDLVRRNLPTAKHNNNHHHGKGRKGSRRIRFRESIMLLEAAGRNDVEEVRLLLESGVNPDVANEDGLTALHQCCIDDNEEMMKLLIDFGANVNAEDSEKWTPLHAAATCGHLHLVQYLIVRGANLLAVNAEGNMPYDICDDETTLDYIESEMAKRGVTQELIEEIRALPETKMLQDIQRVHAQGGDLEFRDPDGATPLHIASANGYYRVAEFLLDNHTATDVQDKDFWQPIHAAACWGHLDVLELLVQNGADLDARTKNNETPYAICEDPEIKERIIQLRTEQQTKRQNEGRKRPSRTHSTNSRTQSIRRTSQRDKGLTSKRDAADEAQMLRAREEHHKENSPSPTADVGGAKTGTPASTNGTAATTVVNGVPANGHPLGGDSQNNIHTNGNGTASSEEEPEITLPPHVLGRDSVGNMKMKQDEMNRLREIAVKSGAMNQNNHHNHLNNHNNHSNTNNGGVKMNNLYNNETNGSLAKNQNNFHKNLNNSASTGGGNGGNSPVTVLPSPDDNGNLLPKPEINPSVDNKVPLGSGLGLASGMPLSGSRDNLVGLSSSAGNSTIDIHVSVTINTNSPVSTLTNGGGLGTPTTTGGIHGHSNGGPHSLPLVTGNGGIFTPPGTLSDLKKQRSLIRTSSNPLTNGGINDGMTKYHPPASPTMSLRRYVGDPAETVGDYGDGGKRCCVIV